MSTPRQIIRTALTSRVPAAQLDDAVQACWRIYASDPHHRDISVIITSYLLMNYPTTRGASRHA